MNNEDINLINIESRNANDSWYGYHYQALCALLCFLCKVGEYLENGLNPHEVHLRVEYIEDFTIFEKNEICGIFQVKKTLSKSIMEEVCSDFLLEQAYLTDNKINYSILSDNNLEKLQLDEVKRIYDVMKIEYLREIDLIISNIEDREFLARNLNLKDNKSVLKKTRQIFRNILNKKISTSKYDLNKISTSDYKNYLFDDAIELRQKVANFGNSQAMEIFYSNLHIIQEQIASIDNKIDNYISQISRYINKGCKSQADIRYSLVNLIYKKLEDRVKNRVQYIIRYDDIKNEILASDTNKYIWDTVLYSGRVNLKKKIDKVCGECSNGCLETCDNNKCIVKKIMTINFEKSLNNFDLEMSTDNIIGMNLINSISNKVSNAKLTFFKKFILEYRDDKNLNVEVNETKDTIRVINSNNQYAMISWLESDDYYDELIKYKAEHMNIYKEYDEILTKEYEDEVNFGNVGIIKNEYEETYELPCSCKEGFVKNVNIKFVTYKKYKE